MIPKELPDIRRKGKVFAYAKEVKNVSKASRYHGISRETFYIFIGGKERLTPTEKKTRSIANLVHRIQIENY